MSRFERWTVWGSAVATAVTGVGFLWAKYMVTPEEPWAVVSHPLEPWFLKAHILFAPFLVFAVGLIVTRHIIPHVTQSLARGRVSGLLMVWTLVPMAVSGYLIQVATGTVFVTVLVVLHIGTGVLFLAGLVGHGIALVLRSLDSSPAPRA